MGTDHSDNSNNLLFLTGLYTRVARQLGVHPSYVSRVARGERRSDRVYRAIASELAKLRGPGISKAQDDGELKASEISAAREVRRRLALSMKADARLRRLSTVIIDGDDAAQGTRGLPRRISPAALSTKVATYARLIAASAPSLGRFSGRLERFPHVVSLLDPDGIVLYSSGTTGMQRKEHRVPGTDWSRDYRGPSAGARAIAARVPVVVIGAFDLQGTFVPSARMACPVILSDRSIGGVLVLTIEVTRARPDHLIELSTIAKRVCKFVENGPMDVPRTSDRMLRIQPYRDAARNVAMVLSLPQIDPATRMALSGMLAELEGQSRATLSGSGGARRKGNRAQANSAN